MMRHSIVERYLVAILAGGVLWLLCPGRAGAQDVLQLFMIGDQRSRMMGGDPYCRPAEGDESMDESGEHTRPALLLSYQYDDVYRERREDGAHSGLRRRLRMADFSIPLAKDPVRPKLRLEIRSSDLLGGLLYTARDRARLQGSDESFIMTYSMNLSHSLRGNLGLGRPLNGTGAPQEFAGGIVFRSGSGLFIFSVGSRNYLQSVRLNIMDVEGILPLDCHETGLRAGVTVTAGEARIRLSVRRGFLSSFPQATREWETRFVPAGLSEGFTASATVPLSSAWAGLIVLERESLSGDGVFYSHGSMYASVSAGSYTNTVAIAAVRFAPPRTATVIADLQYRQMSAGVDGFAETWPFVSMLTSPIAQREYFEVRGSLSLWQVHMGTRVPINRHLTLGFGANGVRLLPALQVNSWESRFLSIGRRGYRERVLPLKRVDGAFVSSGVSMTFDFGTLQYSITQFIPLVVARAEPANGQGSITSRSSTKVVSGGGQFHALAVSYLF